MFVRRGGHPKMRGKAAEIRYVGAPLLAVWEQEMRRGLMTHRQVHLMLKFNVRMEAILTEYKFSNKLLDNAAASFKQCAFDMLQLQSVVAAHFADEAQSLFNVTNKSHMVAHIALLSNHIKPRLCWCFSGEDMMKHTQRLGQNCVKGLDGAKATVKMALHYRLGLHCLFEGMAD